jgi:Fe-S cluster assembly protein SufD
MTLAATKTKAEQALSQAFAAVAQRLPGGQAIAEARKIAIGEFAALGLPHRRIEEWKYTDLRSLLKDALPPAVGEKGYVAAQDIETALEGLASLKAHRLVFVDGIYRSELSAAAPLTGVQFATLAAALAKPTDWGHGALLGAGASGHEAVIALNTAFMTDGAVIRIAKGATLEMPLLLVFVRAGREGRLITTRNVIDLGEGARATLIEAHLTLDSAAPGQANALSKVVLSEGAHLDHVKLTLAGEAASHLATWMVSLDAMTEYRAFQLTAATGLARNNLFATFGGEHARLDVTGCFLGRGSEHIDTTLLIDHMLPGGESRELIKGVLADSSRSVFQGKVVVRPNAQKTDGKQMAQVLMLSQDAEFDSKPELEIHADDVICGHGSTAAEIDRDLLFYLSSRGIPLQEARAMLIESFVGEAIDKVASESLREALGRSAKKRLAALAR